MTILNKLILLLSAAPAPVSKAPSATADIAGGSIWLPPQASTVAEQSDFVFDFLYWLCVVFFVLIVGLMGWFMIKYRREPGVKAESNVSHNTPLELTWTIIPLLLVVGIFYIGLKGFLNIRVAPANSYEVSVTAQKWNWTFAHRNGAVGANVLRVPSGRPVKLVMGSTDVLHSFFVPSFRVKQDVVPGRYTSLWFEAKEPGVYQFMCTEYCGTQHSQMVGLVEVYEPAEFDRVIDEDARWIDKVTDADLHTAGLRLFARCSSCHSLEKDKRLTGPSFWQIHEDWGKDRLLEDGRKVLIDENYVRNSLVNPQGDVVATYGRVMPTFQGQLKKREIDAIIQFLRRLNEVVDQKGAPVGAPGN